MSSPLPRRVLKPHFTCRWCIMRTIISKSLQDEERWAVASPYGWIQPERKFCLFFRHFFKAFRLVCQKLFCKALQLWSEPVAYWFEPPHFIHKSDVYAIAILMWNAAQCKGGCIANHVWPLQPRNFFLMDANMPNFRPWEIFPHWFVFHENLHSMSGIR